MRERERERERERDGGRLVSAAFKRKLKVWLLFCNNRLAVRVLSALNLGLF